MERDYTFTHVGLWWVAQWDTRTESKSLGEIYKWCESQWGHQYRNPRWFYSTSSYGVARIKISYPDDAFAFKMRWG